MMDPEQEPIAQAGEFAENRCQSVTKNGQCRYVALPGSKFCKCHGGIHALHAATKQSIHKYRLARYQERLDQLTDSSEVKNLRSEISVLRFLVQSRLDNCKDENDLAMHASVIARLVNGIQTLSVTCAKVETHLTDVIDRQNAVALATQLLEATRPHLEADDFKNLSDDILAILDRMHSETHGKAASQYKLLKWGKEIDNLMTDDKVISLRSEIGVMRVIIEDALNAANTPYDLILQSSVICGYIQQVEKLVASCHRLEQSTGLLLDKEAALQFCQELITLVGNYVNADDLANVSGVFLQTLNQE